VLQNLIVQPHLLSATQIWVYRCHCRKVGFRFLGTNFLWWVWREGEEENFGQDHRGVSLGVFFLKFALLKNNE